MRPFRETQKLLRARLKGSVVSYINPMESVGEDDQYWDDGSRHSRAHLRGCSDAPELSRVAKNAIHKTLRAKRLLVSAITAWKLLCWLKSNVLC